MQLAYALAQIHHQPSHAAKKTEVVQPGNVFLCHDKDYADFLALGAVRAPSEAEVLLFERHNPPPKAFAATAEKSKGGKGASKTEAPAGSETTSGSADGAESTSGGAGADTVSGASGADTTSGGAGNDLVG